MKERDGELLRRAATILRSPSLATWSRWAGELVLTPDWTPHIPVTSGASSVYTSQFVSGTTSLWLMVNRGPGEATVDLELPCRWPVTRYILPGHSPAPGPTSTMGSSWRR